MILEGAVGPDTLQDGAVNAIRLGRSAEVIVQELHGRYYEQTYRGNMFSAANQAVATLSTGLATTYTGLLLYNPVGSRVNLAMNKVKWSAIASVAANTIGLLNGFSATGGVTAQTTPLTPTNNIIGSPKGTGIALSAATIVTPTYLMQLFEEPATTQAPTGPVDLEGLFIIPPGGFIGFSSVVAAGTGFGFMSWEEIPL